MAKVGRRAFYAGERPALKPLEPGARAAAEAVASNRYRPVGGGLRGG